jgi:Icc-related predicted phosphoesterase
MKILCVADQIDPLVYSTSIKERFKDVDFVLSAGDLPMDYLDFIVSTLNKPLYFVFGNHNLKDFELYQPTSSTQFSNFYVRHAHHYSGATHIDGKLVQDGGVLMAGLGGSMRYNKGKNQFTDFQMRLSMWKMLPRLMWNKIRYGRYVDILLTHASPQGIHDKDDICHRGFPSFLWFMKKFRPRYLIHGHIHLYDLNDVRVSQFEDTTVINAYSHYLIEFEDCCNG